MLNTASPLPLYRQLAERLAGAIEAGDYALGERIPAEHALAQRYRVGRPTVRQATELLVRRGVLERRRGAGTFVTDRPQPLDAFSPRGTLAAFRDRGVAVTTRLLSPPRELDVAADATANPFAGRRAYFVARLSETSQGPALLEQTYLDPEVFVGLDGLELGKRSLAELVRERYRAVPTGGRQELSVAVVDAEHGRPLGLAVGAPVLLARRFLDFPHGASAIYAELYHRTDRVVLTQALGAS